MPYKPFAFSLCTEYVFADAAPRALGEKLRAVGAKKPMVLASPRAFALLAPALEDLALPFVHRADGTSDPTAAFVDSCAAQAAAEGCDFLLAAGGGSAIDAAKAVAMAAANPSPGGIWDFITFAAEPRRPALPVGLLVTIPSTGSESNPSAVIRNEHTGEKLIYTHESLRPVFSVTAPDLTYSLPSAPAAAGIADILSHLLEQYLHNDTAVDVSDNMLLGVMRAVVKWGPVAMRQPEHYDARANLLWASYLAMSRVMSVGHEENWTSHMVEHALSGRFPLPHGAGMAIVLPAYVRMIAPFDRCGRLERLSGEVFSAPGRPAHELLRDFFSALGLPASLSAAGITLTQEERRACVGCALPWGPIQVEGYPPFDGESVLALLESIQ